MKNLSIYFLSLIFFFSSASCFAEVMLGDRYYVKSVLLNVFGNSALLVINNKIIKNGPHFGGPCDFYKQVHTGKLDEDIKDPATFCLNGSSGTGLPQNTKNSIMREGVINLVCTQLTNNRKTLNYALKQAGADIHSKPDFKSIDKIIKLFNPTAEDTSGLINSLLKIKSLSKLKPATQWQVVVKSACSDISWQIL